jgi:excisionase family DNA binding protein
MIEINNNRLTMKQAAQYLGRSYSWLYAGHRSMGLCGYRIGGRWYFDLEDIKDWESNLKLQAAASGRSNGGQRSNPRIVNFI